MQALNFLIMYTEGARYLPGVTYFLPLLLLVVAVVKCIMGFLSHVMDIWVEQVHLQEPQSLLGSICIFRIRTAFEL